MGPGKRWVYRMGGNGVHPPHSHNEFPVDGVLVAAGPIVPN